VSIKLPQLSGPLATFILVRAANLESIEWLLKTLVGKIIESLLFATRAWLLISLDSLSALSTEALPTAGDLVRISED